MDLNLNMTVAVPDVKPKVAAKGKKRKHEDKGDMKASNPASAKKAPEKTVKAPPPAKKNVEKEKPSVLKKIYELRDFADCQIVSQRDKKFPCHRAVLAAQSSAMKKRLDWDQEEGTGEIHLKFANNIVEKFVKFFYDEEIKDDRIKDNFSSYMVLAKQWELPAMKQQVEDEAIRVLSQDNMVELYFLGDEHKAERLKTEAKKGIKKNKKIIKDNLGPIEKKLKKTQLTDLLSILTE